MTDPLLRRSVLAAAVVAVAVPLGAAAQTSGSGRTGDSAPKNRPSAESTTSSAAARTEAQATRLPAADRQFIEKAAIAGMAEVQMGELAQKKASHDQVKQFGRRMVQDHGRANEELKQLAGELGVELPTRLDKKHQQAMQKLEKRSGADFGREYLSMMVEDHKKDVAEFKRQSTTAQNEELRHFAQKTTPLLEEHLKMAQSISDRVKSGKRSAGSGSTGGSSGGGTSGSSGGGTGATGSGSGSGTSR